LIPTDYSPDFEKDRLIAELRQAGIKHSPQNIIKIAKTSDGKIVFLETGNLASGLQHILNKHGLEFAEQGILIDQIPGAIMIAVIQGEIVGFQGRRNKNSRPIYQFTFENQTKYMAVQVASNGYIVSANPRSNIL
jgi:hypothetical protein